MDEEEVIAYEAAPEPVQLGGIPSQLRSKTLHDTDLVEEEEQIDAAALFSRFAGRVFVAEGDKQKGDDVVVFSTGTRREAPTEMLARLQRESAELERVLASLRDDRSVATVCEALSDGARAVRDQLIASERRLRDCRQADRAHLPQLHVSTDADGDRDGDTDGDADGDADGNKTVSDHVTGDQTVSDHVATETARVVAVERKLALLERFVGTPNGDATLCEQLRQLRHRLSLTTPDELGRVKSRVEQLRKALASLGDTLRKQDSVRGVALFRQAKLLADTAERHQRSLDAVPQVHNSVLSAWHVPTDSVPTEGRHHLARVNDCVCVLDPESSTIPVARARTWRRRRASP
ncbi:MAG: hypothetical protein MHM6MM_003803 [Cercozoa sp. M6MM]